MVNKLPEVVECFRILLGIEFIQPFCQLVDGSAVSRRCGRVQFDDRRCGSCSQLYPQFVALFKILREQYELYGEGRANINSSNDQRNALNTGLPPDERRRRLREADPSALGMEGMGGVLIESSRQIESSGVAAGKSIEDGASQIREAGDGFLSGLQNIVKQLNDAASRLQNARIAGATMGAQIGRPPVNADLGRSMPPSSDGSASGGW